MATLAKEADRWLFLLALSVGTLLVFATPKIFGLPFPAVGSTQSGNSSDSEQQLSRQSALWAIAAIALTNMADLPSQMGHYPKELTFWLKSSPLTCLCNVINSLRVIGSSVAADGASFGFERALIHLSTDRFGTDAPALPTSRPVRTILFVLGAVPQAIKLYSCRGITFSQFLTTCYLLDFLNDELILVSFRTASSGKKDADDDNSAPYQFFGSAAFTPSGLHDQLIFLSLFGNMIWSAMLLSTVLRVKVSEASESEWYLWHGASVALLLVVWGMYLYSVGIFARSGKIAQWTRQALWPIAATLCALLLHTYLTIAWDMMKSSWLSIFFAISTVGGFTFWPLTISMALCVYYAFPHLDVQRSKHFPMVGHFFWTSFNITCYYFAYYDASRTYRPGWLDWFG